MSLYETAGKRWISRVSDDSLLFQVRRLEHIFFLDKPRASRYDIFVNYYRGEEGEPGEG
ncbi:MAG: hypothetical protein ACSW8F_00810 [bacterium]